MREILAPVFEHDPDYTHRRCVALEHTVERLLQLLIETNPAYAKQLESIHGFLGQELNELTVREDDRTILQGLGPHRRLERWLHGRSRAINQPGVNKEESFYCVKERVERALSATDGFIDAQKISVKDFFRIFRSYFMIMDKDTSFGNTADYHQTQHGIDLTVTTDTSPHGKAVKRLVKLTHSDRMATLGFSYHWVRGDRRLDHGEWEERYCNWVIQYEISNKALNFPLDLQEDIAIFFNLVEQSACVQIVDFVEQETYSMSLDNNFELPASMCLTIVKGLLDCMRPEIKDSETGWVGFSYPASVTDKTLVNEMVDRNYRLMEIHDVLNTLRSLPLQGELVEGGSSFDCMRAMVYQGRELEATRDVWQYGTDIGTSATWIAIRIHRYLVLVKVGRVCGSSVDLYHLNREWKTRLNAQGVSPSYWGEAMCIEDIPRSEFNMILGSLRELIPAEGCEKLNDPTV